MKASRLVLVAVIAIIVIAAIYGAFVVLSPSKPSGNATWKSAAEYPVQLNGTPGIAGEQCVNSTGYIYCVGGQDSSGGPRSEVLVAPASANITVWNSGGNYPLTINGESCVAYSGYLFCIGGTYDDAGDDVATAYYAPLGSGGSIGSWSASTPFPVPIDSQSCAASGGYVYCLGGNNETDGTDGGSASSNSAWYAQLSHAGIGNWLRTTAYPAGVFFPICFTSSGYIYCTGGVDSSYSPVSSDYFAPVTPTGIGAWKATTDYPIQASGQACAVSADRMYCVGGEQSTGDYTSAVFVAPLSSTGIGSWTQVVSYPLSLQTDCAISAGNMYCVGGFDSSSPGETALVYFASTSKLGG
jgi:hypothetical protein